MDFFKNYFLDSVKVAKVTTKCHEGYPWTLKLAKVSINSVKSSLFFAKKAQKASADGRSPQQELELSPRSRLYLLVFLFVLFL